MQELVSITFSNEMHRPSSAKLWQMPQPAALPIEPFRLGREVPLEEHDTSYRADSAKIFSFSSTFSFILAVHYFLYKNKEKMQHFIF
jgi:hypothetical protein